MSFFAVYKGKFAMLMLTSKRSRGVTRTLFIVLAADFSAAFADMTPVAMTGWNRDIVVENTAAAPFNTFALSFDVPNNFAHYENGLPGSSKGLPQGGAFNSAVDPTTQVQLQPYNAPNVLFMNAAGPNGTLTMTTPAPYNRLAIFASSANGSATSTGTITINFTSGPPSPPISYNAFDWFFVTGSNAINNLGRVNLTNNTFDDGSNGNPRIYQSTIDLSALGLNGQSIQSLTFSKPGNAGTSVVFAISGELNPALSGACCLANGSCTVTSAASCAGAFHAEWADCSVAQCPQPGACCFFDSGQCTVMLSAACVAQNGAFAGEGSSCTPNPCPQPGACCFEDGSCSVVQAAHCDTQNGIFHGEGSVCTTNLCPQLPWACCFADGSCMNLQQTSCTAQGGVWHPSVHCLQFQCPPLNLLVNPGAETGDMSGWTIDASGGNGWAVGFDATVHSGQFSFATSFALDTRHQEVDLLAAGYTEAQLDSAPLVVCSEWVGTRGDCGGQYFVRFELLDVNHQVITAFEHGNAGALIQVPAFTPFFQVSQTFSGYGPGLRYLNFIDGGQDTCFFAGNYGAHFDDALAGLIAQGACCVSGSCSVTTQSACAGTWHGPWMDCNSSPCGGLLLGDLNCDGDVTTADIGPFVLALVNPTGYPVQFPNCNILAGDMNSDGAVNGRDIQPFATLPP